MKWSGTLGETELRIPSCYVDGYEAARKVDPAFAEQYIRHTTVGDPVADAVVAELAETASPRQVHEIISVTLDRYDDPPASTPQSLLNLIADVGAVPDWFDRDLARDATRAFLPPAPVRW